MADQMIFKRYELKYMLTRDQMLTLLEGMAEHMIPDEHGKSTIQSLYFDTPTFGLIRKSIEKPVYKEKFRLRSYGVAGSNTTVFAEIKKKYESIVYKRRQAMSLDEAGRYLLGDEHIYDTQITREIDYFKKCYDGLRPQMLIMYDREAFYAADDHEFRITFDSNILYRRYDLWLDRGIYGTRLIDEDQVLMEVKVGGAMPLWFAHLLNDNHIYLTSFSKYGTAYTRESQNIDVAAIAALEATKKIAGRIYTRPDAYSGRTLRGGMNYA